MHERLQDKVWQIRRWQCLRANQRRFCLVKLVQQGDRRHTCADERLLGLGRKKAFGRTANACYSCVIERIAYTASHRRWRHIRSLLKCRSERIVDLEHSAGFARVLLHVLYDALQHANAWRRRRCRQVRLHRGWRWHIYRRRRGCRPMRRLWWHISAPIKRVPYTLDENAVRTKRIDRLPCKDALP